MATPKKPLNTEEEVTEGRNRLMDEFLKKLERRHLLSQFVKGSLSQMKHHFQRHAFNTTMLSSRKPVSHPPHNDGSNNQKYAAGR